MASSAKEYVAAWRTRSEKDFLDNERMRKKALLEGTRAAKFLAEEFGITKAILFGSVIVPGKFRRGSDIDLAVEGLKPELFFKACGELMMEFYFEIDLKPIEDLKGLIRERVRAGKIIYEKK